MFSSLSNYTEEDNENLSIELCGNNPANAPSGTGLKEVVAEKSNVEEFCHFKKSESDDNDDCVMEPMQGLLGILEKNTSPKYHLSEHCYFPPGSRIIKIEGPKSFLKKHANMKGFLVPMHIEHGSRRLTAFRSIRDFKSKRFIREKGYPSMFHLHRSMDKAFDMECVIDLVAYDLFAMEKCNNLVFAFMANEILLEPRIVEDYTLNDSDPMKSHYDLDGFIVLSHFVLDPEILDIPPHLPGLATEVHGSRGFGDRGRSRCLGYCSFSGHKNTRASCPLPL